MQRKKFELSIQANIRDTQGGGFLSVSESVDIDAMDFLEIAKILGQFHDLAQKIKTQQPQS